MRKFAITFQSEIDQIEIREIECEYLELGDYWAEFFNADPLVTKRILAIPTELIYRIEEL